MRFNGIRIWLHGALALMLAACGGGGDGGIGGTGGTQPGSDISIGTITAFGSVWVNGVEFKSNAATITIDDNPHPESDLRVGMIARVSGSIGAASASTISVTSAAKGFVESINGSNLVVMGQTVVIDASTIVSNGPIAAGQYVEVHGQVVSDGTIQASYVERKTTLATPPFVVKGFVKGHTQGGTTFQIGNLNVSVGAGATTNDMPGTSWNGILVEVKGSTCASNPVCGTLTASKVEPETPRTDVAKIEVENFVTALTSTSDFTVGSQRVVTNASTQFVGGLQSEIVLGMKVEVEGSLSGGVLTATKVSFRENIRFEANVASNSGTSITLQGLGGITISTNSLTEFKNVANLAALAVNSNIRVRGRPAANGGVIATELEFRSASASTDVRFQALVSSAANPNLTMLGVVVNTANISDNNFLDHGNNVIGRAAFFNAIGAGNKVVKVRGTMQGATVNWNREAELEDD